jgi:hypothetical protein
MITSTKVLPNEYYAASASTSRGFADGTPGYSEVVEETWSGSHGPKTSVKVYREGKAITRMKLDGSSAELADRLRAGTATLDDVRMDGL